MRLKELAELQMKYSHLERTTMTKKSLCDLIIPFRDKYALTDGQALRVARREFTLNQIEKLMKVCSMDTAPTVDAIPVEDIKLHRILINNEGVPEAKLQIGERYFTIYTDPVDVREVVHGRWIAIGGNRYTRVSQCSNCCAKYDFCSPYCPNCGAKMDGDGNG